MLTQALVDTEAEANLIYGDKKLFKEKSQFRMGKWDTQS